MQLRQYLGEVFRELARHKESRIEEGHLQADHVHMLLSIPPKYPDVLDADWSRMDGEARYVHFHDDYGLFVRLLRVQSSMRR